MTNVLNKFLNSKILNFPKKFLFFIKTGSVSDIYLYILVVLYPILPSYFIFLGVRIHTVLAAICLLLIFTTPQLYKTQCSIPKIIVVFTIFLCYSASAIYNNEFFTMEFLSYISSYFVIPIYCALLVDSKHKFDKVSSLMIVSCLVLCFFSLFELFFGFNIFSLLETVDIGAIGSGSIERFGIYRIESSFGQAIAFAIYLSFVLCLVFYKLFKNENQKNSKQNLYLILVGVIDLFIILTSSRFPIIIMVLLNVLCFIKLNKRSKIKVSIAVGILSLIIIAYTLLVGDSIIGKLIDNIVAIFNGNTSNDDHNSLGYRLGLYENSKKVIGPDYLFGRGLHVNTYFVMVSPYYGLFSSTSFDNGYIYIFLMQGYFGLFAWLLFCFSVFYVSIMFYDKEYNSYIVYPMLMLLLTCLLNMLSVARLDESRSFMVIIGCYLGLNLVKPKFVRSEAKDFYEVVI